MSIKEQLMADYKEAMKAHDTVAKQTVNLARAAIKQIEIDERVELNDNEAAAVIQKQVKMRTDALADFEKAGRMDLLESYKAEIKVLNKYLPEQLSEDKIAEAVEKTAAELGIESGMKNMGKLIKSVMVDLKGQADGSAVQKQVKEFLSK